MFFENQHNLYKEIVKDWYRDRKITIYGNSKSSFGLGRIINQGTNINEGYSEFI